MLNKVLQHSLTGSVQEQGGIQILKIKPTRCNVSQFIYFYKMLYTFQTGFPSVIGSSKLHIQRQAFVRPLLLPVASRPGSIVCALYHKL